jgi:histidinol dehydrogenase
MSRFQALEDFELRFDTMDVDELRKWKKYWTQHAQQLAPKVRKQAMKRVHDIDKAIERRVQQNAE